MQPWDGITIFLKSHFTQAPLYARTGGGCTTFWIRGHAIGDGINFINFPLNGIRNGIDFHNLWYKEQYQLCKFEHTFSENWYKVGYIFSNNGIGNE